MEKKPSHTHFGDNRLGCIFDYWLKKKDRRTMPVREDIDLSELCPELHPFLMLTAVLEDGRLRYDRVGSAIEAIAGLSLGGVYLDEVLLPPYLEYVLGLYDEVIRGRCPLYTESAYPPTRTQAEHYTKRLMMPVGSGQEKVCLVLSGQVFIEGSSPRAGRTAIGSPSAFKETLRQIL